MKDVKRASRSEEGHRQERTENEPEGERDFTREERAAIAAGAVAGLGRSQRLTLAQLPRFPEVSGNPLTPNRKAAGLAFSSGSFLAGCKILGLVSCIGMFSTVKPFFFNWGFLKQGIGLLFPFTS